MSIFGSSSPPSSPTSALRTPANKRISLPAAERLSTITEGANARPMPNVEPDLDGVPPSRPGTGRSRPTTPSVPPRSILRNSPYNNHSHNGESTFPSSTAVSTRTAPPAYTWIPEPIETVNEREEREKLSELRRAAGATKGMRGGWGRIILIGGVIALIVVGLSVGLGVGLTVGRRNNSGSGDGGQSTGSSPPPQAFPLGQYSFETNLRSTATNCTSNSATWRCFPYSTYDPAKPMMSELTSNWIIRNSSSSYASNTTNPTSSDGIPANLTISSTANPLSVTFHDQPLTYFGSPNNGSAARLTFSFSTNKNVIPSAAITSDNTAAICYFNSTTFEGTIYLKAPAMLSQSGSTAQAATLPAGQSEPWPYAVEIVQRSPGGQDVPACYTAVNGAATGARITTGLQPQPTESQCLCQYNNF